MARLHNLDFLRIVFTFEILLAHVLFEVNLPNHGGFCVEFFFILSGVVFTLTYDKSKSVYDFLKEKIIRFLPIITICSLLRILTKGVNLRRFFIDISLLPYPGMINEDGYGEVAWYITILFWVSLFYFYLLKISKKETANLVIGLISFISLIALSKFGGGKWVTLEKAGQLGYLINSSFLRGLRGMGVGFFLVKICRDIDFGFKNKMLISLFEAVVLIYSIICLFYKKTYFGLYPFGIICFATLILLFMKNRGYVTQFLNNRFLQIYRGTVWQFM